MVDALLEPEGMEVCWTTIWNNSYGRLFKPQTEARKQVSEAGPDAQAPSAQSTPVQPAAPLQPVANTNPHDILTPAIPSHLHRSQLVFTFSPEMKNLVSPPLDKVPYGTDTWAVHHGKASVTPMRATFCPGGEGEETVAGSTWTW
ncbi:hypothetical protein FRC09_018814 [Ceratobasidium sp. 395]|nr:hypothetical protein FRC09_018814 [Ceratobasidium sp. 395]